MSDDFSNVERELIRRAAARDEAPVEPLWAGVQARIARGRRRRFIGWASGVAAAAAAVVIVTVLPRGTELDDEETPAAAAALDKAESEYLHAINTLESRVERREQSLPAAAIESRRMARARTRAALMRAQAPEASARVRQIEGYAAYLRSLRRELDDQ